MNDTQPTNLPTEPCQPWTYRPNTPTDAFRAARIMIDCLNVWITTGEQVSEDRQLGVGMFFEAVNAVIAGGENEYERKLREKEL